MSTFADADAVYRCDARCRAYLLLCSDHHLIGRERPLLNASIDRRFVSEYFVDAQPCTSVSQQSSLAAGAEEASRVTDTEASPCTGEILEEAPCAGHIDAFDEARVSSEQERIVDMADAEPDQVDRENLARPTQCISSTVAQAPNSSSSENPKISASAYQTADALNSSEAPPTGLGHDSVESVVLERIWVYPIKSCAGFAPDSWPLGQNGLLYDREWALVDAEGEALTQKKLPRLATVRPSLNMDAGTILLHSLSRSLLVIPNMSANACTSEHRVACVRDMQTHHISAPLDTGRSKFALLLCQCLPDRPRLLIVVSF